MPMDHYAVLGNPIAHSQSPFIHAQFAQATEQDIMYQAIEVSLDHFAEALREFFAQGGQGCNVTLPFKEEAYRICTRHTQRAAAAKAVNTIKRTMHGLLGDNTDGVGLITDLQTYTTLANMHILLLGAGGATRGVLLPLLHANPALITIANRTVEKAGLLCQEFARESVSLQAVALTQLPQQVDLIINATSVSLQRTPLTLPDSLFASARLAYDMVYGPSPSPFLQQAIRCGVPYAIDGLGMLVHQAAEAFYLWRGIYPETESVLLTLRQQQD